MSRTCPPDLFSCIREKDERILHEYKSTSDELKKTGAAGFFLPAMAGGMFFILLGILSGGILFSESRISGAVIFFGMLLCACATLLYAMFLRRARSAEGTALYITTVRVIYISGGSYAAFAISEIESARIERPARLGRVPFDISALEGEYLVLSLRGGEQRLPFIENAEDAKEKILGLLG